MPKRRATARWQGSIGEGDGTFAVGSGAFEGAYSFQSRFEQGDGTNPEELIGAAHAGCFSMALAGILGAAGHEPESIATEAEVEIAKVGDGFEIKRIALITTGRVPGIDEEGFRRHAEAAKQGCPVSKALAAVPEITLESRLEV